ncbi:MAG: HAMP domain-containing sensor histidine kinase [Bacteroidota bacterium]
MKSKTLRQNAEKQLGLLKKEKQISFSETETLKLLHELQVHQIELEMQNANLVLANEQEKLAKEKYKELYDFAPSAYFTLSMDGNIIELNLSAAQLLSKDLLPLVNSRFAFFVSLNTRSIFNLFFQKLLKSHTKGRCEVVIQTEENLLKDVFIEGIMSKNRKYCRLNVTDITERKKVKEDLVTTNMALVLQKELNAVKAETELIINQQNKVLTKVNLDKDKLITILAHDLRSPFNSLIGLSDLLVINLHEFDYEFIERIAKNINHSATMTLKLLEDLLLWIRAQSGKISFDPKSYNFTEICSDVVETLIQGAVNKEITVNFDKETEFNIYADVDMINTVLRNLISNAVKYANNKGLINIYAKKDSTYITITVSDNGVGIKAERMKQLFEISQIQTTAGTANERGTGFGLLICKEFVEQNGGEIWVESEVGKGSDFIFTIPLFPKEIA